MKLSELYQHKAAYEEMIAALKKHEELPCVSSALYELTGAMQKCEHYEKWGIECSYWDDDIKFGGIGIYTMHIKEIPNQTWDESLTSHALVFDEPQELLMIWFSTGPYIFGQDYPIELFNEFYFVLKTACPPAYEDDMNHQLYYRPEDAARAYETCKNLYKEYTDKYKEQAKAREIKRLEEELAKLKSETEGGAQ